MLYEVITVPAPVVGFAVEVLLVVGVVVFFVVADQVLQGGGNAPEAPELEP